MRSAKAPAKPALSKDFSLVFDDKQQQIGGKGNNVQNLFSFLVTLRLTLTLTVFVVWLCSLLFVPIYEVRERRCVFVCVHAPHRMLQQQSTRARVLLHEEHSEPAHITRMNLINLEIAWAHLDLIIRLSLLGVVWKPAHFRPKKR